MSPEQAAARIPRPAANLFPSDKQSTRAGRSGISRSPGASIRRRSQADAPKARPGKDQRAEGAARQESPIAAGGTTTWWSQTGPSARSEARTDNDKNAEAGGAR